MFLPFYVYLWNILWTFETIHANALSTFYCDYFELFVDNIDETFAWRYLIFHEHIYVHLVLCNYTKAI